MTLSLQIADAEEAAAADAAIQLPALPSLRVLAAEDNPANQLMIKLLLEQVTAAVVFVENGQAAVEARQTSDFDVILMDMQMPELGGVEATRAIRIFERATGSRRLPIVMLTASSAEEDKAAAKNAGADGFVSKPIRPAALYAELDRVCGRVPDNAEGEPQLEGARIALSFSRGRD
jgi:CheY-like chemotaxis protein